MPVRNSTFSMRVQILDDNNEVTSGPITVIGREAWCLRKLLDAGEKGVSSLDNVGPRLAHYVYRLRGYGFAIETVYEKHGGDFPGSHARCRNFSKVQILSDKVRAAA